DLRLLLAVIDRGSMAKAAAYLNLTQSGVSKAIADIEHTLDVRLFDRTTRGVEPTLYGRALHKWGNAVFDDLRQGIKEIEYLADPTTGELRIGCSEAMTAGFVSAVSDRLTRRYPRLILRVTHDEPLTLQSLHLRERKIELVIARVQPAFAEDDMEAEILFKEPALVVAGTRNKWVDRRRIQLSELADEPWTLPPPESLSGSHLQRAFRASGLDYPPASTVVAGATQINATPGA